MECSGGCLYWLAWLNGPTLMSVAHEAGLSTAMVFGKQKFNYLILPNSVDEISGADIHDDEVKDRAVEIIQRSLPMFCLFTSQTPTG